ncbi:MAG: alpha/beta hydrolase [Candidatus Hodarchaeota archaeon]
MTSIFAKIMIKQLLKNRDLKADLKDVEEFRKFFENMVSKVKPAKGIDLEEIQIGDIPAEKHSSRSKDSRLIMLYLHGGGYFFGSYVAYRGFVSKLCKELRLQHAYCINYQLAPENPYPAGLDDAFFTYKWMLEEKSIPAENIIIMGDSAGGGLTLALLHRIGKQNLPKPKAAICLSPWTDMTFTSKTLVTKKEEAPFFCIENIKTAAFAYMNSHDPKNPEISPMFADFNGFPPVFLQVGTRELLLDDSLVIAEKMKKNGVPVTLDVHEGMFHAFLAMMGFMPFRQLVPEFKRALKYVKKFVEDL